MFIILSDRFVAGIFEDVGSLANHLVSLPSSTSVEVNRVELGYPFWIEETNSGEFAFDQHRSEWRDEVHTMFRIDGDFTPDPAWTDQMGNLPHFHRDEE